MASVYTRRDGKPRTTTFSDFGAHKDHLYGKHKFVRTNFNDKFSHMKETNWTCKHEERRENLLEIGKPPKIRYSTSSTSRQSYQDPAKRMANWKKSSATPSRYSGNPNPDPVAGIVPNAIVLPPLLSSKDEKKAPTSPIPILNEVTNEEE